MARKYRVTKGPEAQQNTASRNSRNGNGRSNGASNGNGNGSRTKRGRSNGNSGNRAPSRWPWISLCLLGMLFIIAVGMSRTPSGEGLLVVIPAMLARAIRSVAGIFSMFLCFMIILNSVVKIVNPQDPLPRFVWGLWVFFVFGSAIWHSYSVAWVDVFAAARSGGGGGMVGAAVYWFLRTAITRYLAILAMALGIAVSVSLIIGRSPWTPFSLIWMAAMSAWQWFRDLLGMIFKEHGPRPEDIDTDDDEGADSDEDDDMDKMPQRRRQGQETGGFSNTVTELRDRLAKQETQVAGQSAATAMEQRPVAAPGSVKAPEVRPGDLDKLASEFAPLVEQPALTEAMFYELPSFDLLQKPDVRRAVRGKDDIDSTSRVIERALLSFGVVAKVVNVDQGPTVTRFELQPGPGVKVASIVNLSQDLALALAAQDVRIEAPIPGRSAVGLEVPNKEVSAVHLREVLEMREFRTSRSPLTIALGKDVSGKAVVTTLDHCLHLLIAGATGSGKSVCINSLISSILYKARPDEVKLVLIDPKRVELTVWGKVPHLIAPVVSDPKKAAGALRWAIKEMESRYEKFTKVGTRDIDRYNEVATPPGSPKPAMPYIVIVIDELSDLMMVAPAEVEDAIFRLAQMARASGIYLVVATQRPSVDVLTGTIKANIPTRIAFAVASQIDSRTILDAAGAEKLLGRGDMLFSPVGSTKPLRAQGCYISEREIDELVSFVSAQAKPQFAAGILAVPETIEGKDTEVQDDPFFSQALRIVVEAKQASVSLLQRKLPIGYSRAARLIDAMEVKGYVGPYEGSKPREVKLTIDAYMRMFESTGDSESGGPGGGGVGGSGPSAPAPYSLPPTGGGNPMITGATAPPPHVGLTSPSAGSENTSATPEGEPTPILPTQRPPGAAGAAHIDESIFRRPSFLDRPGTMAKGSFRRENPRKDSH